MRSGWPVGGHRAVDAPVEGQVSGQGSFPPAIHPPPSPLADVIQLPGQRSRRIDASKIPERLEQTTAAENPKHVERAERIKGNKALRRSDIFGHRSELPFRGRTAKQIETARVKQHEKEPEEHRYHRGLALNSPMRCRSRRMSCLSTARERGERVIARRCRFMESTVSSEESVVVMLNQTRSRPRMFIPFCQPRGPATRWPSQSVPRRSDVA